MKSHPFYSKKDLILSLLKLFCVIVVITLGIGCIYYFLNHSSSGNIYLILLVTLPVLYGIGTFTSDIIDHCIHTSSHSNEKIVFSNWHLFFLILVLGMACIYYAFISHSIIGDSAALYVGLPLLLALGLSLIPKTKSAFAATMKGMTIALLLSAIIFKEGYRCIFFASPLFYGLGVLIALSIDYLRKRKDKRSIFQSSIITTILALLSLEGTTDITTFPRYNQITVSKTINAPITEVRNQIASSPTFGNSKPFFLSIFPYPTLIEGDGIHIGDTRTVTFIMYKHIFWSKIEGQLILKVVESTPNIIKFITLSDNSYVSHYLDWQSSEVSLESIDTNHTKVTWALSYKRILDPAWYFGPIQNYAVKLVAEELIDHVATPNKLSE